MKIQENFTFSINQITLQPKQMANKIMDPLIDVNLLLSQYSQILQIYKKRQFERMKSNRLKNFCEVCRKQCKDQNGYHCHLNSAHHQKRLRELATNPQQHIQKYSNELENRIVQILKSKYPGQAKDIQDIYEEYAEDKHHVKFNFTRWKGLPQFVQHLRQNVRNLQVVGKVPYCNVTYVVSKAGDFMKKKKEEELIQRKEREKQIVQKGLEDRMNRVRQMETQRLRQIRQKLRKQDQNIEQIDLQNQQFRFDLNQKTYQPSKLFTQIEQDKSQALNLNENNKTKQKNVDRLIQQIQSKQKNKKKQGVNQEIEQQQFQWIIPGIIVKILPHEIPEVFHGKKTAVIQVKEPYVAEVKLGNATINIDQAYLQTVVPKTGHEVKMLKGGLRNQNGILRQVDIQNGIGIIEINGHKKQVPFNQFSKIS